MGTLTLTQDRRGSAALELAIVLPLLLVMLVGGISVTQVIRARMAAANAADTMAELIAAQTSVTGTSMSDLCAGAQLVMAPYATAGLQLSVASVTNNAQTGKVDVDWQDTSCGGGSQIAAPATDAASLVPNPGDSAIVVQATYAYTNPLTLVLPAEFTFTQLAFDRPRDAAGVAHN